MYLVALLVSDMCISLRWVLGGLPVPHTLCCWPQIQCCLLCLGPAVVVTDAPA
jgi:hypothetical protein